MQVVEHQFAHHIRRVTGEQTHFQTDERHGQVRPDRVSEDAPGIGAQTGRDIHRRHRQTAGIDRSNGTGIRVAHVTAQTRAEQGVEHDTTQLRLRAPRFDRDLFRHGLGMGQAGIALQPLRIADRQYPHRPSGAPGQHRHQIAITGIVALPCQHAQFGRRWPLTNQRSPGRPSRTLHQFEALCSGRDQARIKSPDLCGAVQRVG